MNHNDQSQRIAYMIGLWEKVNPGCEGTLSTTINNTSIGRLCETSGGPYQRVITWLEKKVDELSPAETEEPTESEYRNMLLEERTLTDMEKADREFQKCFELMKSRNEKYGSSWKKLRNDSIVDLCIMKLDRCQKQSLDDHAIEVEAEDCINYLVFLLMNIRNK